MKAPEGLLSDPKLARLLVALEATGCETRIVGGAVRDTLLGLKPHEVDLTTTALPVAVIAAAGRAGLKSVPTGIDHGTVTVIVDGTPFEVTTLREDVETDGRFAKVRFGHDFAQDALRRDFTVNALSVSTDGRLHDYTDGLADIEARRIRFIGDPATRIAEDHLRVLRFFRFHAAHGEGPLDPPGLHAAIVARESLAKLSAERVRAELMKLLSARRAVEVARDMSQNGVMEVIVGVCFPARLERLDAVERVAGQRPDALLRLAALAVLTKEDAERLRGRLRLSNSEHKRLAAAAEVLVGLHGAEAPPGELELTKLLFLYGCEGACDALALAQAESAAPTDDKDWLAALRYARETPPPNFPVKGADLLARGLAPGQALGETLKALQAKWIRAGFPRDPAIVKRLVEEAAESAQVKKAD
jgi:poly(A) polymerase